MATRNSKSGVVIDFASAKRKILRKRAATEAAVDPLGAPMLEAWVAKTDTSTLEIFRAHLLALAHDDTRSIAQIAASIRRDIVRQAARAAL